MKFVKHTLLIAAIAFFSIQSFAQGTAKTSVAAQAATVTEFEVNGLKVLLKRRESAPTFAGGLFFRGGVRNQTAANAGIENLTLSSATEAGTKFNRQQVRRQLAATGSSIGAGAGRDYSSIAFVSTTQNFDRIWDIFADVTLAPAFAVADVERVRQQMLAGLREAETSPDGALHSAADRVINAGHPYSVASSGTIQTVTGLKITDLKNYHKDLLQTSRMLLVIVGDIDPDVLKTKVTQTFGKLPVGNYKESPTAQLKWNAPTVDITQRAIPTNYVLGTYSAPSLGDPDYYAMRVATTILQQMVYEEVRQKRQLSYAPNAELNNNAANTGTIYVTAVDANQSVQVMIDQIRMLQRELLNDEAISGMAGQFLTGYYLSQETNVAQVRELAQYELIGGGWRRGFDFLDRIQAVNARDVQRVARKYMNNLRFTVIGDPAAVNKDVFMKTAPLVPAM